MMRLVFSDLRNHAAAWIGAFVIAVACGFIGGCIVSFQETAAYYPEGPHWSLMNAASMMLTFSTPAGIAVLIAAANLTVSVQRRSYALWQLANVKPTFVSGVVLAQLVIVSFLGSVCGTLLTILSFGTLFPLVFGSADVFAHVVPQAGIHRVPVVWLLVAAIFLCGGFAGALRAGRTPPLTALRPPEVKRKGMTWLRMFLLFGSIAGIIWVRSVMTGLTPYDASSWAVLVLVLVVVGLVSIAPPLLSMVLKAWTSIIPQNRWNAWYLARHTASHSLSISTSVETPIMVGFALVAGLISILNAFAEYYRRLGETDTSGWVLDPVTAVLTVGGPVLLCAIGAAVSVAMTSSSRTRDVALLVASGSTRSNLVAESVCEAFIHAITATFVGVVGVMVSSVVINDVFGMPLLSGVSFEVGFIVSIVGFILVLAATLAPTLSSFGQETAVVLSMQE